MSACTHSLFEGEFHTDPGRTPKKLTYCACMSVPEKEINFASDKTVSTIWPWLAIDNKEKSAYAC